MSESLKEFKELVAEAFVFVLNRALKADPVAINALFAHRVECNEALADDSTIQVRNYDGPVSVGILGIVNGLVGINYETDQGYIAGVYDSDDKSKTIDLNGKG